MSSDRTTIDPTLVRRLIEAATRAPSSHNTQPWLFRVTGGRIDLVADRSRALPVNDPRDRELTISCGAALRNLEIAAAHEGLAARVELLPEPDDPDLVASVDLSVGRGDTGDVTAFEAISRRHTTRKAFDGDDVDDDLGRRLGETADCGDVAFHVLESDDRSRLAALVSEGDRAQFADPRWRRELASWMHPRRHGQGLVVPEVVGLVTRMVVRRIDLGESTAGSDVELVDEAPLVGILASDEDDERAWIRVGRELENLLLRAASEGLVAGYLNQPCQVEEIRPRLRQLVPGHQHPQIVLRFGRLETWPTPSPRRRVDDVLIA